MDTSANYVPGAHRTHRIYLRMSLLGDVLGKVWHSCLSSRWGIYCATMPLATKTTSCRSGGLPALLAVSALRQLNPTALTMSDKTHQQRSPAGRGGLGVVKQESPTPDIPYSPSVTYVCPKCKSTYLLPQDQVLEDADFHFPHGGEDPLHYQGTNPYSYTLRGAV